MDSNSTGPPPSPTDIWQKLGGIVFAVLAGLYSFYAWWLSKISRRTGKSSSWESAVEELRRDMESMRGHLHSQIRNQSNELNTQMEHLSNRMTEAENMAEVDQRDTMRTLGRMELSIDQLESNVSGLVGDIRALRRTLSARNMERGLGGHGGMGGTDADRDPDDPSSGRGNGGTR